MPFAGKTPLRILRNCCVRFHCNVYGKLETYNPTGSHKDRESEEIMKLAIRNNVRGLAIASTGNAAISLAAYSYIHGLKCHVYVPETIAPERLSQIQAYNPIVTLAKTYDEAITECQSTAEREGLLNCNPGSRMEKIEGDSGIGVEIAKRQDWTYVVCPTNNGTLLAGVWTGLKKKRARTKMIASVAKETRLAEAIAGFHRFEEHALLETLHQSKGGVVEVTDDEIRDAACLLMSDGLVVEGAAAAAIAALKHLELTTEMKVCCVITGTGLKFPSSVKELLSTSQS